MIPHTLVLKPGLVIHSIYNGYWFWGRPSVVDLWHDLRAVSSEIRPDWDLSSAGLREPGTRAISRPSTGGTSGRSETGRGLAGRRNDDDVDSTHRAGPSAPRCRGRPSS